MPRYERYHGVRIPQEAIRAAVELSVRYLPGRYLPDKAIDLLDEAAAALRISGGEQSMLPGSKMPVLTSAEIAKVVGKASGVPAERVGEAERVRLDQLEAERRDLNRENRLLWQKNAGLGERLARLEQSQEMARVNDRASEEDTTAALTVSRHGVCCNRLQESCKTDRT